MAALITALEFGVEELVRLRKRSSHSGKATKAAATTYAQPLVSPRHLLRQGQAQTTRPEFLKRGRVSCSAPSRAAGAMQGKAGDARSFCCRCC